MKEFTLSDLEWDFSDVSEVRLEGPKFVITITKEELAGLIESWKENEEE